MIYEILNEQGTVANRIDADLAFVELHYAGRFRLVEAPALTPVVPAKVFRRQALQALLLAGLLDSVQPAINAIEDPMQRGLAQIEWDASLEFERSRPLVAAIGQAIGLDATALDALFITAAGL